MYRSAENTCLMLHFKQKYCNSCDKVLIQIDDVLYELKVHYNKGCRVIDRSNRISDSENVIKTEQQSWTEELIFLPENYPQPDECLVDTFEDVCNTTNEIAMKTVEEIKEDFLDEDQSHSDIKYPTTNDNLIKPFETDTAQRNENNIFKPSVKRKAKEPRIKCSRCEAVFFKRQALSDHIKNEHKGKPYVCNVCGEKYNRKHSLNVHAGIHSTETNVTCDICKEGFQNRYIILKHMKIHIGKFPCQFCDQKFTTSGNAKIHEYRAHEKKICKICNEEYTDSRTHTLSHRREINPRFICNYCGKAFAVKNHLNEHLNRHTGTKSYTCEYCKKGFVTQSELRAHTRTHTGEKPFKCTIEGCTRAYTYDVDLRRHRFSAHGIYTKKHICHICSKVYSERKLLRKHIESHAKA